MHRSFERSITIAARPEKVCRVFTDPSITRQMGGEYVTDWTVGSPFGFRGLDGAMFTRGSILAIQPGRLLKHDLFEGADASTVVSTITYGFEAAGEQTLLHAREDFTTPRDASDFAEIAAGWDAALAQVKALAEVDAATIVAPGTP